VYAALAALRVADHEETLRIVQGPSAAGRGEGTCGIPSRSWMRRAYSAKVCSSAAAQLSAAHLVYTVVEEYRSAEPETLAQKLEPRGIGAYQASVMM
jgi:hypothetical protein